jgi:hypothetical protein
MTDAIVPTHGLAPSGCSQFKLRRFIGIFCGVLCSTYGSFAQAPSDPPAGPRTRQSAEFFRQIDALAKLYVLRSDELVLDREQIADFALVAKHITFKPNAKVVLRDSTLQDAFYIIADRIDVQGPAAITWIRRDTIEAPPDRQKAPDGAPGRGEGAEGGRGADGQAGNVGYPGHSAPPVIVLLARTFVGEGLTIDVRGERGGPGGRGQDGGSGGDGGRGAPASQSAFDCKRGPGPGGKGGAAGNGGPGGQGGTGGNGGDVVVLVTGDSANGFKALKVYNSGGPGGSPGVPGRPGQPGRGGDEGEKQLPFCAPAGRVGPVGDQGTAGAPGNAGTTGVTGSYSSVELPGRLLSSIYGENP